MSASSLTYHRLAALRDERQDLLLAGHFDQQNDFDYYALRYLDRRIAELSEDLETIEQR